MKNLKALITLRHFVLLGFFLSLLPQKLKSQQFHTAQDSIGHFLDSAFQIVPSSALYSDKIDWKQVRSALKNKAGNMMAFSAIFPEWQIVFDSMRDNHSFFWYDNTKYAAHYGQLNEEDVRPGLMNALEAGKAVVTAKRLGNYGYVMVPPDNSPDDFDIMQRSAQQLQEAICRIYDKSLEGWIIDLRLNTGGNMYPMIAGIQQLIGEGTFASIQKKNGDLIPWSIKADGIYQEKERITALASACLPDLSKDKVVVLTSQITGSSGEITALAFLNRPNTYFIGETTAGFMTSNELYRLPFNTMLLLAEGYEVDSNGNRVTRVIPDKEMIDGDNFDKPEEDSKVRAAIAWLAGH